MSESRWIEYRVRALVPDGEQAPSNEAVGSVIEIGTEGAPLELGLNVVEQWVVQDDRGADLLAALKLMRADYRSEGCSDPACSVCAASKAARAAADAAIAKADA